MTTSPHIPHTAPPAGYSGPKRALILSGGGMRVSYQAGVILALQEAGLCFAHADATSGGTINQAMLFSGLSAVEMCERWMTLKVKDSVSLMSLEEYLNAADRLALGDADGIIDDIFPHIGVDMQKINNAQGMVGTFNVCNFTRKTNEAITHDQLDLDLLVGAISLPLFLPPVPKDDYLYCDAGWIKCANLMEAVRRGAEELWVIWCLGNTDEYKAGFANQYLHMVQLAANGSLFEEFKQINEINERINRGEPVYGHTNSIKLHLIKPEYPLPPDPELYLDRINNATLIDMGYADAKKYLTNMSENGIPFQPEATKMKDDILGVTFRETMAGEFALDETDPKVGNEKGEADGTVLSMHATINIRDLNRFISDPNHVGSITGRIDFGPFGEQIPGKNGVFNLFSPADEPELKLMVYEFGFEHGGQDYYLAGKKEVRDDPGFDMWSDTTTLFTQLHQGTDKTGPVVGAGILSLSVAELIKMVSSMQVTHAQSTKERAQAMLDFGRFFMGDLWETYAQ